MEEWLTIFLAFVREHPNYTVPVVALLAFGESLAFISLVLPFWGILVALGTMISTGSSSLFYSVLTAAAVGAALGDWVSYYLGKHYHKEIAAMWPLSRSPNLLPMGHAFFEKWGVFAVVIGRFSGPLRASVPLVAGATEMAQWKFQIANWSSAFLWSGVLLMLGGSTAALMNYLTSINMGTIKEFLEYLIRTFLL